LRIAHRIEKLAKQSLHIGTVTTYWNQNRLIITG